MSDLPDIVAATAHGNPDLLSDLYFREKNFENLTDTTNGALGVSNNIIIDAQSFSDGKFRLFSQGILVIPYLITTNVTAVLNTAATAGANYAVAFKGPGAMSCVDRILIRANSNTSLTDSIPYQNVVEHINMMLDTSTDQLKKNAATLGFYPDTSDSTNVFTVSNAGIVLETNNNIAPAVSNTAAQGTVPNQASNVNVGLLQRCKYLAPNASAAAVTTAAQGQTTWAAIPNSGGALGLQPGMNSVSTILTGANPPSATSQFQQVYTGYLVIPLANLHPIFKALDFPLKDIRWYMSIYLNGQIQGVATHSSGSMNPLMINASAATAASTTVLTAQGYTSAGITYGVYNAPAGAAAASGYVTTSGPCRLYVPTVSMTAELTRNIFGNGWERDVSYYDHQYFAQQKIGNSASATTVNYTPVSGLTDARKIYVWLTLNSASVAGTGSLPTTVGGSILDQYTTCQPFQAVPFAYLNNTQILINNTPINPTLMYLSGFEVFHEHTVQQTLGGFRSNDAVSSGLFNNYDYVQGTNGYMCFDLTKNPNLARSDLPCNITISSQLYAPFWVDLNVLVITEKAIRINQSEGKTTLVKGNPTVHLT